MIALGHHHLWFEIQVIGTNHGTTGDRRAVFYLLRRRPGDRQIEPFFYRKVEAPVTAQHLYKLLSRQ